MSGRGYGRGRRDAGGPAYCVCPNCGYKVQHTRGVPCLSMRCPNCGAAMMPSF